MDSDNSLQNFNGTSGNDGLAENGTNAGAGGMVGAENTNNYGQNNFGGQGLGSTTVNMGGQAPYAANNWQESVPNLSMVNMPAGTVDAAANPVAGNGQWNMAQAPMGMDVQTMGQAVSQPINPSMEQVMGQPAGQVVNQAGNFAFNPQDPVQMQKTLEELRERKKGDTLTGMIVLFVVGAAAIVFFALFVVMFFNWEQAKSNVEGQVKAQVALAEKNKEEKMNAEFQEREKSPLKRFSGPIDYGELSFQYPKTWSLYIAKDANKGGDYQAYFNQDNVNLSNKESEAILALRLRIVNSSIDKVTKDYDKIIKDGKMTSSTGLVNGQSATIYNGTLKNGQNVRIAIFTIRDKTVVFQTDAAKQYGRDFDQILASVSYNK